MLGSTPTTLRIARVFTRRMPRRAFVDVAAAAAPQSQAAPPPPTPAAQAEARRAYAVPRNANGGVPVFTDLKANDAKTLLWIRNVDGDANALAHDLKASLFPHGTAEAARMVARVVRSRHVVLEGGDANWKYRVLTWLKDRGL